MGISVSLEPAVSIFHGTGIYLADYKA